MARDERGVELCLLVSVQVKTRGVGEAPGKYFSEPMTDPDTGAVRGWCFRDDDRRHVDSWLRNEIPHLLVLHDANMSVSYYSGSLVALLSLGGQHGHGRGMAPRGPPHLPPPPTGRYRAGL